MKFDDFKTRLTGFAGSGQKLKKLPHHILIPVGLVVLVILLVGFKLVTGFHHYQQRSADAALKSIAAAQTENAGAVDALGNPILPGLAAPPASLRPGTAEQTVTCPGQATGASAVTALSATFTVPESVKAGCTVTWAFFTQVLQTDSGFGTKLDPNTGVFLPLGEPVSIVAHGAPAAVVTVTTDGGHVVKFQHRANDDLANAQGPYLLAAGWHRLAVAVSIVGAGDSPNDAQSPKPLVIEFDTGTAAPTPYWPATATAIPHIAQQASNAGSTATANVAPPPAAIEPPVGVQAGKVTEKIFSQDQWGQWAQVTATTLDAQSLNLRGSATNGQRVAWSAWIDLDKPVSVAVLRVATGPATVTASLDGSPLGQPMNYTPFAGPASQTATVSLAPGWHEVEVQADRGRFAVGPGVAIQIALGDGQAEPLSPQPWAIPPGAQSPTSAPAIPHIAQHPPTASSAPTPAVSSSPTSRGNPATSAASTTTGASK